MGDYFKRYRSVLNTAALISLILIPFFLYAAATGDASLFLVPGLAGMGIVMAYVLKNG